MNRLRYRIVFNRARAMLMAVAETASSTGTGKTAAASASGSAASRPDVSWMAISAIQLAIGIGLGLPIIASAQIVGDPNAGANRPGVIQTANGLPQVNITRPSGAGVSVNQYSQFDVNRPGAILNNSPVITNTQQAGYINGNPNLLPGGAARIIVNQVNSTSPSQLRGYLEVAGQRADVVIANPNGLLVDGAGFINTSRVTLTTGTPIYGGSGSLDAFRVSGGQISVEGAGLNAASVDQVDLIARAVKANAALYANRLNVVAGANQVDYGTLATSAIAPSGAASAVGIDVSELGGMYANKILLASTELGVGVSNRGVLAAQAGDLTLTAQGKLVLAGQTSATGNLAISARDGVDNSGTTYARGNIGLDSDAALDNRGTLVAQQSVGIRAGQLNSTGTLAAGMGPDGKPAGTGDLTISTLRAASATGSNLATGNVDITGSSINLAGSQTVANGAMNLSAIAGNLDLSGATVNAGTHLSATTAGALDNTRGQVTAQGDLAIHAAALANDAGLLSAGGALSANVSGAGSNRQGSVTGGAVKLTAASLDNTAGQIESDALAIKATGDVVNQGGSIKQYGQTDAIIAAGGKLDNTGGTVAANGKNLTLEAGSLSNDTGKLSHAGAGTLTATVQGTARNVNGAIETNGTLQAQLGSFLGAGGAVSAGKALSLASHGAVDNTNASLLAGASLSLEADGTLTNAGGTISAATTTLQSASLDNAGGHIDGDRVTISTTGSLSNRGGTIKQYGDTATSVTAGGELDNTSGSIVANGVDLDIAGASLINDGGTVSHAGSGTLDVTSQGALSNNTGTIQTNGTLQAKAVTLDNNSGKISAQGALSAITSGTLNNRQGSLYGNDGLSIASGGSVDNTSGSAQTKGDLGIVATGAVTNVDGTLAANGSDGEVSISATGIDNSRGALLNAGTGSTTVKATASLTNTAGRIGGNGDVSIAAQTFTNNANGTTAAQVAAGGALDLQVTNRLENRGGTLYGQDVTFDQAGATLDNASGQVLGGTGIRLGLLSMSNLGGAVKANQDIAMTGALGGSGTFLAGRNLTLNLAGDYTNDASNQLRANGTLKLSTSGTLTNTASLAAAGALDLSGANIVNAAGASIASGSTTIAAGNLLANAGRIEGDTVQASAATVSNTGTVIGNNVTVRGTDIVNNGASALMASVQNLNLYASNSVQNLDGATLYSAGNLQIARDGTRDPNSGLLANQTNSLINRSATIEADGDIDIAANQVQNTRTNIVTTAGTPVQTAVKTLVLWQAGLSGGDLNYHASITFPGWMWSTSAAPVSTPQTNALRAPITVTVDKSDVKNLDLGSKTLSFATSPIEEYYAVYSMGPNCDEETLICKRPIATQPTQYYQAIQDNGTTYSITFWPDWDPNIHIRPDEVRQANFGTDFNEISRTTVTMTATDQLVSASDPAKIQAGGNIRINSNNGSVLNQSSTMAAGGNLVRVAANGSIQDVGTVLQQTVTTQDTSTFYWHQRTGGSQKWEEVAFPSAPQASTTTAALPAIATGNQTVQTTAQNVTVASVNTVGAAVTGASITGGGGTGTQAAAATGSTNGTGAVSGATGQRPPQTLGTAKGGIPNLRLPSNGLYTFRTAPGDTYLVATDSRFTQYTRFISSDYMLDALGLDPQKTQKRLGDGFYEQKLIRDQVTQLTGKTFLEGYGDQLEEYKALMNNGVTYGKSFGLTPGVGLTDEQMLQLTTDMVWMVSQDVTLPDGTTQSVLVPKVYLAQGSGVDLNATGALVAGGSVAINATGTVANSGSIVGNIATQVVGTDIVNRGNIGGTGTTVVKATQDVRNLGGRIGGEDVVVSAGRDIVNASQTITNTTTLANGNSASATGVGAVATIAGSNNVALLAGRDISMAGGAVDAGNNALLAAGRDLNIGTVQLGTTQDATAHGGKDYLRDQTVVNQGSTVQSGGNVTAVAGGDATLTGSMIDAGGDAALVAGRNTTVTAAMDSRTQEAGAFSNKASQFTQSSYDEGARGSSVQGGNNVTLAAGQTTVAGQILGANGITPAAVEGATTGDVTVLGSSVSTGSATGNGGAVKLVATGDVTVGAVTEQHDAQNWSQTKKSGFLSKTETTKTSRSHDTVAVGSVVSGDSIVGSAGRDMTISGSTVAGTGDVMLEAGRNLTITTAESTSESYSYSHTKATGFGATGGGISYGMRDQKDTTNDRSVTQTGSLVGSTDGNVSMKAGSTLHVTGSQVIAAKDLTGVGADVIIDAAVGSEHHDETHEIKQTGFTLGVSGGAIGSAISAGQKVSSATKSQDGRASALWGIAAGRDAYDAAMGAGDAMKSLADGKGPAGTAVTLSFGTSKTKNTFTQDSTTHTGSNIQAGGTATFIATGVDADGNKTTGNLDIIGSDISATKVGLGAKGDVNIVSATDTYESHSTNKSSSGTIGVSYGAQGFGVSASASASKGNSDTTGTTQVNSHITGSESVSILSGNDTNILGGVVSGGKVSADVGGNLNLASRQDTEESRARQQSVGGGLSFSQGGGVSGSFSASKGKSDGSYANVTEQTGILAGDGGFDIHVKGNTDLKGAIIASTATEDKNKLSTGTLSWSDIENKSDYSATSLGISGGFTFGPKVDDKKSGQTSGKNTGGVSPMIPQHESGSERGVAQSGIAGGTITVTDQANQTQDVATLNRDTSNTNSTVGKGPDLGNLLGKQADMMAAAQAAGEAVAKTVGDIAGSKEKAAKEALKAATEAYEKDPSDANRASIDAANADIANWKEGGEYRAALHAAGGAMIAGLGGGNALAGAVGAGLSSLAADKLASVGRSVADGVDSGNKNLDEAIGNLAANLVAGGIGAAVGGGSGAATAANVDRFNRQLHPDERKWAKDNARSFAQYYKSAKGEDLTLDQAENMLLANGYRIVDAAASKGPGGDSVAINYISQYAGDLFSRTPEEYNKPFLYGNADGSLTPEQRALPGAKGNPAAGLAITAGIVTAGLAPEVAAAIAVATRACASNPVLCLNQAGIVAGEVAAGGAMPLGTGASVPTLGGKAAAEAAAAKLNNFYRDGASPELIQQTYNQAALSSTHNSRASEVILGKYIAGSQNSYEAVAEARGATYFSMSDWFSVRAQLGEKNMWSINQAFLDQQISQGKTFIFTANPANAASGTYAAEEFKYLQEKGYLIVPDKSGFYRAIK
ncbi:hemagglutinin repeat-containing protein [Cupriavidus sp. DL-D2]|uniref:two-partner secretion domain-containing protein n=1 Tax=Cupriavidus sp. DL-D2 TaxID=3144974 RepID=UPI0032120394